MKQIFLTALLSIVIVVLIQAQPRWNVEINAEPQVGHSYSKDLGIDYKPLIRADFGISALYNISPRLKTGSGLFHTIKARQFDDQMIFSGHDQSERVKINIVNYYMEIPLLLKYSFGDQRKNHFVFGLSYLYLYGVKSVYTLAPDTVMGQPVSIFMANDNTYYSRDALDDYRQHTTGLWLGYGRSYALNEHITMGGELLFKPVILPLFSSENSIASYLYSMGVNVFINLDFSRS